VGSDSPILICYDGSPGARHAIEYAASLFPGKRACVLNVWAYPAELSVYGLGGAAVYSETPQRDAATARAAEGSALARQLGLDATPIAVSGSIDGMQRTILRVADEHDASVVIMGSRGLGSVRSLVLGSVSHGVVQHAHRPVLVVPPTPEAKAAEGSDAALEVGSAH
jgi:nucleotide-binding universal stress UspA family protein